MRIYSDYPKLNDTAHILYSYPQQRSTLKDAIKLLNLRFTGKKVVVIFATMIITIRCRR